MGILRKDKKPDKDEEFMENVSYAQEQQPQGPTSPQEYIDLIGQRYFMIKDDKEEKIFTRNRQLENLGPAFTSLNQLTNIDEKEAKIRRYKYKVLLLKLKGYTKVKDYASGASILISSLDIRSRNIISDAIRGWKGRILTEDSKTTRIELEKVKKRRWPR